MLKDKFKASLIHLVISTIIVIITLGLITYFWYPLNYLYISRFIQIAIVLVCVDLVMGPVLTFVVYNAKKASLKFDLSVIAFLQLAAIGYGGYMLFQNHPLYVTFTIDRYTLVTTQDAEPKKAQYNEYKISKLSSPQLAFAALPETIEAKNELMLGVLAGAKDLDQRTDLYKPYLENLPAINAKAIETSRILADKENSPEVAKFFSKYGDNIDDYIFLPLNGQTRHVLAAVNKKTGQLVTTIDVDPWQYKRKAKVASAIE